MNPHAYRRVDKAFGISPDGSVRLWALLADRYACTMNRRFQALDGMRGVAALAVLSHHIGAARHQTLWFGHAYIAVDFFFMLSGFVIGAAYEARLSAGLGWPAYMGIRLRRLYPMVVVGALIGLAAGPVLRPEFKPAVLAAAAALQLIYVPLVRGQGEAFPLNVVQWSLCFELVTNGLHAAVHRWLRTEVLAIVTAIAAAALIAVEAVHGSLNVGATRQTLGLGLVRALFPFAAGLLIHRLYRAGRMPVGAIPFPVAACVLGAVLAVPRLPHVPDTIFVALIFPLLIISVLGEQPRAAWSRGAVLAGDVSYPLYAIHAPLVGLAAAFAPRLAAPEVRAAYWAATTVSIIVLAWALGRFYDEPVRRRLQAFVRHPRTR